MQGEKRKGLETPAFKESFEEEKPAKEIEKAFQEGQEKRLVSYFLPVQWASLFMTMHL